MIYVVLGGVFWAHLLFPERHAEVFVVRAYLY